MTLVMLCSGQGTQHSEMFALTADAPQAASVFAAATQALGRDPRIFVREAGETAINENLAGQILCSAQALAAFAAIKDVGRHISGGRLTIAGYSIGELAAWGCAGVFSPEATIDLARQRAMLMNEASGPDDGLAFVRGLSRDKVGALCARHASAVAIVNPAALYVVGGARSDLRAICEEALAAGAAKAGPLKVSVASHTSRLAKASPLFREALAAQKAARKSPGIRLIGGVDAAPVLDLQAGLDKLADQISQTIDWAACLEACVEAGVDRFFELGPGRALTNMASDAYPQINARSLEDFRNLDGARAWLAHG